MNNYLPDYCPVIITILLYIQKNAGLIETCVTKGKGRFMESLALTKSLLLTFRIQTGNRWFAFLQVRRYVFKSFLYSNISSIQQS